MEEWEQTLRAALDLAPAHISLYGLEVKGGTELKRRVLRGEVAIPSDDLSADMYEMAKLRLGQAGFKHYEISNWARPNFESRHNRQYWHNQPIWGLGRGRTAMQQGIGRLLCDLRSGMWSLRVLPCGLRFRGRLPRQSACACLLRMR